MKLLTIELSRATVLFRMTRPGGPQYLPDNVAALAKRYHFLGAPDLLRELEGSKAVFRHGTFEGNAIDRLEVYNDGIIVSSRSDTDHVDGFIEDCVAWLRDYEGYSVIETHTVSRMYESTLLVETERDVLKPLEAYQEILRLIENALLDTSSLKIAYHIFGFALSADQTQNPALKPVPFRLERKEGIDFGRHQYFAIAPLRTKQHLKILQQLDELC